MERNDFYRYTRILFLIKQQYIDINIEIRDYVRSAILMSQMTDEEIFLEVATYYELLPN